MTAHAGPNPHLPRSGGGGRILLTGGTGFVGTRVAHALRTTGRDVRCLVREPGRASRLEAWGCELTAGDMTNAESLARAIEGCQAVIHLVSIIEGKREDFDRVMRSGTENLVSVAGAAGVQRFLLMSAIGAEIRGGAGVPYYSAKAAMELTVRSSGIGHAVLRPSFIFGNGGILPRFVRIVRYLPATPVPGPGEQRIQPIWVDDVARAMPLALDHPDDLLVELGGPEVVTWNALWKRIAQALGKRRPLVHVPFSLLRPPAAVLERLPKPVLTRDQLRMLATGNNVVGDGGAGMARLGLTDLVPLDEQLRRTV